MGSGAFDYALRLCEDRLPASGRCSLPALNRVLYVRRGALSVMTGARAARVEEDQGWHGAAACEVGVGRAVAGGGAPGRGVRPGGAWFEGGHEPVLAVAWKDEPTSFVRVAILPREIRGRTSIMYVNPHDAERGRPRTYTVYIDEPIEIT